MRLPIKLLVVAAMMFLLASSVYADGTGFLTYSTCGQGETADKILDKDGSPVGIGNLVQLWDTNTNQIIDTTQIGSGVATNRAGRFAAIINLPTGPYNLKIRVYNSDSPVCAVVVGSSGRGSNGFDVNITGIPQDVCFVTAQIPNQNYVAGEGGCSAPSAVQLQSFSATSTSIATEPALLLSLTVLILSGGWAVGWVVLSYVRKAELNLLHGRG